MWIVSQLKLRCSNFLNWYTVKKFFAKRKYFDLRRSMVKSRFYIFFKSLFNSFLNRKYNQKYLKKKYSKTSGLSLSTSIFQILKKILNRFKSPKNLIRYMIWSEIFITIMIVIKKYLTRTLFNLTKHPKTLEDKVTPDTPIHWLTRPKTISRIWIGGCITLLTLIFLEFLLNQQGYFGIDATFGFNAWFGFLVCIAMVLIAKGLGFFLKRKDTFYEHD